MQFLSGLLGAVIGGGIVAWFNYLYLWKGAKKIEKILKKMESFHTRHTMSSEQENMGIKASATCVLNFDEAEGYLVGAPHSGMRAMFTFMNAARLHVGIQGIGLAEAAYQMAVAFARERKPFGKALATERDYGHFVRRSFIAEGFEKLAFAVGEVGRHRNPEGHQEVAALVCGLDALSRHLHDL